MRSGLILMALLCLSCLGGCGDDEPASSTERKPDFVHRPPTIQPWDPAKLVTDTVTGQEMVGGETLATMALGSDRRQLDVALTMLPFKAEVVGEVPDFGIAQIRYEGVTDEEARDALRKLPALEAAVGNFVYVPDRDFNDPVLHDDDPVNDYGLRKIRAIEAWDHTTGEGVKVAVIDDGVDPNHPELRGKVTSTWSYKTRSPRQEFKRFKRRVKDDAGRIHIVDDRVGNHGTHVAGTIAAMADNDEGTVGVAPSVEILAYQVIYYRPPRPGEQFGSNVGSLSDITAAISSALGAGAQVINMSLGPGLRKLRARLDNPSTRAETERGILQRRDQDLAFYRRVMTTVTSRGVIITVSAGNNDMPASYAPLPVLPETIAVGASDINDNRAEFSSFDPGGANRTVDVCAPGVDVWSSIVDGGYKLMNGTSMSSPHVAGVAALLKSVAPSASHVEVRRVLVTTGDRIRTDKDIGPRVDAFRAVEEMLRQRPVIKDPPKVPPKPPGDARRPLPPGCKWSGRPIIEIRIILNLGGGARWLGQLVRYLIDLFFGGIRFSNGGRYDEFGRYMRPPGIVNVGPPSGWKTGGDRYLWIWEYSRAAKNAAGRTLADHLVKELDQVLGTPKGAVTQPKKDPTSKPKRHKDDPDPVAMDAPGVVGVWALEEERSLETLLQAFLPKNVDRSSAKGREAIRRTREYLKKLELVLSIKPNGTWFARASLEADQANARGTWTRSGSKWVFATTEDNGKKTDKVPPFHATREARVLRIKDTATAATFYMIRR